jgi:cytochrome bd-type quinol oxidase subunit 1
MEFQFGLNWSGLATYAGDVFGAPLAMETLIAFFLESTFLGLWIFGWGRLDRWAHLALIWLVTITAYASAFWIMVANGFLQHPVGQRHQVGLEGTEPFTGVGPGGEGADLHVGMGQEQAQDLSPGVPAGSGDGDACRGHMHDYTRDCMQLGSGCRLSDAMG